jgi:hypothetical protein
MPHFAQIDPMNLVINVIVADPEFIETLPDADTWIQTSYNTRGGLHYSPETGEPDDGTALRKNYAGIGFTYDRIRDAFIPPQPFTSWTLNEASCLWEAPISYPESPGTYVWNEDLLAWMIEGGDE